MSLYSKLDDTTIRQLAEKFEIGPVNRWKVLKGGVENTNHLLETTTKKYVLTLCERKTAEETTILADLLTHLASHQFSTSVLFLNKKNQKVSFYQEKPVLLKSYIEGSVQEIINDDILLQIGKSIAKLNQINPPKDLPTQFSYGQQNFHQLSEKNITHPFTAWLEKTHQYILKNLHPTLPKALIHGDIFASNVIISDKKVPIIMDFEEACYYYRIFDLGMAIVGLCRENERLVWSKAKLLIQGYCDILPLTPLEKEKLPVFIIYGATATAFWRFRQFNILAPTESMKDDYKAMQAIADQVFREMQEVSW